MYPKILCILISYFVPILIFNACSEKTITETEPSLAEEFQKVIDDAQQTYNLKGVSAAVITEGQNVWLGCSGNSHENVPMSSEMLFHTGSSGKNFTAALVLQLAAENKLSLEDSLHKWLPPFTHVDSTITIHQLLNHTSGIYNYTEDPAVWEVIFADPLKVWTPEEIINQFVKEPYFAPGQGWYYSNANYILLGMIIRLATGSEISDELRSRFFDPFELDQTFFAGEEEISGNMAHGWYDFNQDDIVDDMSFMPMNSFYTFGWTSGAIVTTAEDLATWAGLLYRGSILSPAYLEKMLTFYPRQEPVATGYGLGSERYEFHNRVLYGHSGGGFHHSVFMYLPQDQVCLAVLTNQATSHILDIGGELINTFLNYQ